MINITKEQAEIIIDALYWIDAKGAASDDEILLIGELKEKVNAVS